MRQPALPAASPSPAACSPASEALPGGVSCENGEREIEIGTKRNLSYRSSFWGTTISDRSFIETSPRENKCDYGSHLERVDALAADIFGLLLLVHLASHVTQFDVLVSDCGVQSSQLVLSSYLLRLFSILRLQSLVLGRGEELEGVVG